MNRRRRRTIVSGMHIDAVVDDLPADVPELLELLTDTHPSIALAMARALDRAGSPGLRTIATRLLEVISDESLLNHRSRRDRLPRAAPRSPRSIAGRTATSMRCSSTSRGRLPSAPGNSPRRPSPRRGWAAWRTRRSRIALPASGSGSRSPSQIAQGALSFDADRQVMEVASPVGVVFAVVPVTNPVATVMFKTLIALKARNALILSVPRQAARVGDRTIGIVRDVLTLHGLPADLVQSVKRRGRNVTRRLHATRRCGARAGDRRSNAGRRRLQFRQTGDRRRAGQRAGVDRRRRRSGSRRRRDRREQDVRPRSHLRRRALTWWSTTAPRRSLPRR